MRRSLSQALLIALILPISPAAPAAADGRLPAAVVAAMLVEAYPDFLDRAEGNELVWKDGSRMPIDDGRGPKALETLLAAPDIKDQFLMPYPLGRTGLPPAPAADPGRVRYLPLFDRMYGSCRAEAGAQKLVEIEWPTPGSRERLKVTAVNGVADKLARVGRELARLPPGFATFITPSAGTYACRAIAGTSRMSAHGYAIAIDISVRHSDYWRWAKPDGAGQYRYRNRIPWEIVEIFEAHGFIWGGKWHHYDTMHFEYRPELVLAAKAAAAR